MSPSAVTLHFPFHILHFMQAWFPKVERRPSSNLERGLRLSKRHDESAVRKGLSIGCLWEKEAGNQREVVKEGVLRELGEENRGLLEIVKR